MSHFDKLKNMELILSKKVKRKLKKRIFEVECDDKLQSQSLEGERGGKNKISINMTLIQ